MSETSLSTLVKEIGEALVLDDSNQDKAAYKKYVYCIYKIATNLILSMRTAGGNVVVDSKTCKQVKLAQQCVERVSTLLEKMDASASPAVMYTSPAVTSDLSVAPPSTLGIGLPDVQIPSAVSTRAETSVHQQQPLTTVHSDELSGQFINSVPSLVIENNPYTYRVHKSAMLTPMEIARKQNQSLMIAYKARMERLNRSDFNAFNYSLTIQRKMAENIAIAQAQEEELARKMQARNLRLEEEAAKRFATPMGMSKEEQEQRQIYKKILEYENEAKWLRNWRSKLEASPEDPILISQLVQEILRCSDHPFTQLLHKYQFQIYQSLYPLVANRHEEIDLVTVPLPTTAWPSIDDVADVFTECFHSATSLVEMSFNSDRDNQDKTSTSAVGERVVQNLSEVNSCNDPLHIQSETRTDVNDVTCEPSGLLSENIRSVPDSGDQDVVGSAVDCSETSCDTTKMSVQLIPDSKEQECQTLASIISDDAAQTRSIDSVKNVCDSGKQDGDGNNTKKDVNLTVDKGKELESEVSYERRQAQLLMRQVTRDYNSYKLGHSDYDENNLDYLFDDDEDDDSWFPSNDNIKTSHQKYSPSDISLSQDHISSSEVIGQGPNLDRSVSHTPMATRDLSVNEDVSQFQSLPTNVGRENKSLEEKEFEKLSQEAYQRHLKSISEDIHRYLEKLLVMMTIAYEPLDTPVGKDQCAVSLEEPFFKPIWKTLLRLFRVVNHKQELALAYVMTKCAETSPQHFKVSKKLWLSDSMCKPYQRAITELMHVKEHYTMLSKLECVVKVCRLICECVDDHYKRESGPVSTSNRKAPSVGADDLLPILCYVVVQTATPQLCSECQAMTEFIHEGYMMGEEGYCLTSLRTALSYVISMFPSLIESCQTHQAIKN